MELVAGLWLKVDGTFEHYLTVGSLDETATGALDRGPQSHHVDTVCLALVGQISTLLVGR
jgi:hypothetical protein